ncbi:MAG: deoxyuridine 5'-triphosphate nucleotidohydrolase [Lachnospiraceae bacterium]|nr:deoxyuridine 5'-triphosphate nucleotidohydrolase [Lachnospiraceae bacterium]
MNRVAKFEKVSYEQFRKDMIETFNLDVHGIDGITTENLIKKLYDEIKLPQRATGGSAGYDFFAPYDLNFPPNRTNKIPTGIRVKMNDDYVLMCFPRSGLGFKYRMRLDNTVGVVDSDYYGSNNEGHIFLKMTNETLDGKELKIHQGDAFAQGVFLQYGITVDDEADGIRNGGFGSTDRKE